MLLIAIIIGCFIGFGISYMCIGIMLSKSNDHGDSKGSLQDFTRGTWRITGRQDHIKKPKL